MRIGPMVWICTLALTVGLIAIASTNALRAVATHGLTTLFVIASAAGLGVSITRALRLNRAPRRWRVFFALGFGHGALSLIVLALGSAGLLNRTLWWTLLGLFFASGVAQIRSFVKPSAEDHAPGESASPLSWLWLTLAPFAAAVLLIATMPPGILWPSEGGGYDALEYHLGAPRDYYDAGRIAYLPHNIYSNFPFNMEMLYLLAMVLHGDPIHAAVTAQLIHAAFAIMAVGGVWLAGREVSRGAGIVAAVFAGTTPFLFYLSGLAYVEHGLLLYSALALACLIRALKADWPPLNWALAAGLFAGFACGCKYTGVAATFLPVLIVLVFYSARRSGKQFGSPVVFVIGALIAMSPWLVKNTLATGNPVFPLGYSVFGAKAGVWDDRLADQWHRGHLPAEKDRTLAGRTHRLGIQILWSPFFGPLVVIGVAAGVALPFLRRRSTAKTSETNEPDAATPALILCGSMILIGTAVWFGFTHLVDRFAIVLIAPCAVLGGIAWFLLPSPPIRRVALALPILVAIYNGGAIPRLLSTGQIEAPANDAATRSTGIDYLQADIFGQTAILTGPSPIAPAHLGRVNQLLRDGRRVLVVGDARRFNYERGADYCVVFNRNPFAEAAETRSPAELVEWLQSAGYDYLYVDWLEMRRLRSTYGFWDSITPELFRDLNAAGLTAVEDFRIEAAGGPYGTLFAVPNPS